MMMMMMMRMCTECCILQSCCLTLAGLLSVVLFAEGMWDGCKWRSFQAERLAVSSHAASP